MLKRISILLLACLMLTACGKKEQPHELVMSAEARNSGMYELGNSSILVSEHFDIYADDILSYKRVMADDSVIENDITLTSKQSKEFNKIMKRMTNVYTSQVGDEGIRWQFKTYEDGVEALDTGLGYVDDVEVLDDMADFLEDVIYGD